MTSTVFVKWYMASNQHWTPTVLSFTATPLLSLVGQSSKASHTSLLSERFHCVCCCCQPLLWPQLCACEQHNCSWKKKNKLHMLKQNVDQLTSLLEAELVADLHASWFCNPYPLCMPPSLANRHHRPHCHLTAHCLGDWSFYIIFLFNIISIIIIIVVIFNSWEDNTTSGAEHHDADICAGSVCGGDGAAVPSVNGTGQALWVWSNTTRAEALEHSGLLCCRSSSVSTRSALFTFSFCLAWCFMPRSSPLFGLQAAATLSKCIKNSGRHSRSAKCPSDPLKTKSSKNVLEFMARCFKHRLTCQFLEEEATVLVMGWKKNWPLSFIIKKHVVWDEMITM